MTNLSGVDKYKRRRERSSLQRLLDLDGIILEVGEGYWVEFHVTQVPPTNTKPHGIDYGLCLLDPKGKRLVCYDNAHAVPIGHKPKPKSKTNDHVHLKNRVRPYPYVDAEKLMEDFWNDVEKILKERGIP